MVVVNSLLGGVRSIVMSVWLSVSMSVCLFACIFQKPHRRTLPNFLCMLPVAMAQSSSDGVVIGYVLPVLCMTSFHAMTLRHVVYF